MRQDAIDFHYKREQLKIDDDTEIVVVSDTVRQRRSRTPISATPDSSVVFVMPDLLPQTFQTATTDEFSRASDDKTQLREAPYSVVAIKERDLQSISSVESPTKVGRIVDTINILESCNQLQLQQVETVHIIDASSDTDTAASTPLLSRKSWKSLGSVGSSTDELKCELKRELDTVSDFSTPPSEDFCVKKQKISENGHRALAKDRDILKDSEKPQEVNNMKLRPTLRDLLMEERCNSFYGADKDNDDEPLEFSDDDEIPRYSIEMDSDSDLVVKRDPFESFSLTFLCFR